MTRYVIHRYIVTALKLLFTIITLLLLKNTGDVSKPNAIDIKYKN